jgi:hypothetical protein
MRMIASVEAWIVLLAAVTACGPLVTWESVRPDSRGASADNPTLRLEHAPAHPPWLGYQIMRKEGFLSEQGAKPCKITAAGTALRVNAHPSCVYSAEPSTAISAVVQRTSLLSLCCLLIV